MCPNCIYLKVHDEMEDLKESIHKIELIPGSKGEEGLQVSKGEKGELGPKGNSRSDG